MTDSQHRLDPTAPDGPVTGRRQVLYGAGALAATTTLLAGCSTGPSSAATGGGGGATATVPTSEVPVGGGKILTSPAVVVTQPTQGEFKAFSAVCPHMGCAVTSIQSGDIVCPCHSSRFAIATGDVVQGPAPRGLTPLTVAVSGSDLTVS